MRILDDVVGITVENEVITDLPEAIRIDFHHDVIPVSLCTFCSLFVCMIVIISNFKLSKTTLLNVSLNPFVKCVSKTHTQKNDDTYSQLS